jgi:hypothetical protein
MPLARQKLVNDPGPAIRRWIGQEGPHLLDRWDYADQIEVDAAQEFCNVCARGGGLREISVSGLNQLVDALVERRLRSSRPGSEACKNDNKQTTDGGAD